MSERELRARQAHVRSGRFFLGRTFDLVSAGNVIQLTPRVRVTVLARFTRPRVCQLLVISNTRYPTDPRWMLIVTMMPLCQTNIGAVWRRGND